MLSHRAHSCCLILLTTSSDPSVPNPRGDRVKLAAKKLDYEENRKKADESKRDKIVKIMRQEEIR
jgi:hypothetical protein